MSGQFSDQCKTCALAGTCKAQGCIKTATALIDEYKAEIAELKACNKRQSETIDGLDCGVVILRSKTNAEITELKDEVENLNGELMFRPTYSKLTERIAELESQQQVKLQGENGND